MSCSSCVGGDAAIEGVPCDPDQYTSPSDLGEISIMGGEPTSAEYGEYLNILRTTGDMIINWMAAVTVVLCLLLIGLLYVSGCTSMWWYSAPVALIGMSVAERLLQ